MTVKRWLFNTSQLSITERMSIIHLTAHTVTLAVLCQLKRTSQVKKCISCLKRTL